MRIVALAETGTRGLLGAVIGGQGERAEVPLARKLVTLLGEGMLLLAGRAYDAADLLTAIAATGAQFLVRGSASRKPGVGQILPDGSYLSQVDGLRVRIIEADLDVHGAGSRPRPGHRSPRRRGLRRPRRRRPDRPCRPGRPAARPPPALQRPQGQMLYLPLPRPRRRTRPGPSLPVRDDHPGAGHHPG